MYPTKLHVVQDDIESFVILILYHALRYMRHNAFDLKDIMFRVFDDGTVGPDGYSRGGQGKEALFLRRQHIGKGLKFTDNEPITRWVDLAIGFVAQWQYHVNPPPTLPFLPPPQPIPDDQVLLRNHQHLIDLWDDVLAMPGWPLNDRAVDYCPTTSDRTTVTGKRGNSNNDEGEHEDEEAPKKKKNRSGVVLISSRTLRSSTKKN